MRGAFQGAHTSREGTECGERDWCGGLGPQNSPQEVVSAMGRMPAPRESDTSRTGTATDTELCSEPSG